MQTEKPPKLLLTFKVTERDIYDEIAKHSCKSAWIKEIIAAHIANSEKPCNTPK